MGTDVSVVGGVIVNCGVYKRIDGVVVGVSEIFRRIYEPTR